MRCGEMLQAIEPATGKHWETKRGGNPPSITRKQAAEDAGLSEDQARGTCLARGGTSIHPIRHAPSFIKQNSASPSDGQKYTTTQLMEFTAWKEWKVNSLSEWSQQWSNGY